MPVEYRGSIFGPQKAVFVKRPRSSAAQQKEVSTNDKPKAAVNLPVLMEAIEYMENTLAAIHKTRMDAESDPLGNYTNTLFEASMSELPKKELNWVNGEIPTAANSAPYAPSRQRATPELTYMAEVFRDMGREVMSEIQEVIDGETEEMEETAMAMARVQQFVQQAQAMETRRQHSLFWNTCSNEVSGDNAGAVVGCP